MIGFYDNEKIGIYSGVNWAHVDGTDRKTSFTDSYEMFYQKPIKEWSKAAKQMLREAIIFLVLVLMVSPAWALTSAELDALVPIIIQAESSGNPLAVGDAGRSRGLMQIQKATWKSMCGYSGDEAFDPAKNFQVGRHILEEINIVYNDNYGVKADAAHILFSYNTGHYIIGSLPEWTKKHPNRVYRRIFNEKATTV